MVNIICIFMMIFIMVIIHMVILIMVIIAMSFVSLRDERTLLLRHISLYLYQSVQTVDGERDIAPRQFSRESFHDGK